MVIEVVKEFYTEKPIKRATVEVDGVRGSFKAYILDTRWNGFAEPFFDKEEGMKIVRALSSAPDVKFSYWPSTDAFVEKWERDKPFAYKPYRVQTVDGPRKLWPIGAAYWTWTIKKMGW